MSEKDRELTEYLRKLAKEQERREGKRKQPRKRDTDDKRSPRN